MRSSLIESNQNHYSQSTNYTCFLVLHFEFYILFSYQYFVGGDFDLLCTSDPPFSPVVRRNGIVGRSMSVRRLCQSDVYPSRGGVEGNFCGE